MDFDARRAKFSGPDQFPRFTPPATGVPLSAAELNDDTDIIVFERGGEERALLSNQMAYPHAAQGELAGEPYLVCF